MISPELIGGSANSSASFCASGSRPLARSNDQ
jgi:hypothetical protein